VSTGGIGLRNTQARLSQMYGDDQHLAIGAAEEGGTLVVVELPYRAAPAASAARAAPGDRRAAPASHER
jgi:LytS/YehU family sensor histidine kinase